MSLNQFSDLLGKVAADIEGLPLDDDLAQRLNQGFGPGTELFSSLAALCQEGEADGWLMGREAAGIRYGRAIKPGTTAGAFSVDVVRMKDVRGPHHIHTEGEIGVVFPLEGDPTFDGMPSGWYVYPPGSDHHPTVAGGDAHVLYLLPNGAIEFTGK